MANVLAYMDEDEYERWKQRKKQREQEAENAPPAPSPWRAAMGGAPAPAPEAPPPMQMPPEPPIQQAPSGPNPWQAAMQQYVQPEPMPQYQAPPMAPPAEMPPVAPEPPPEEFNPWRQAWQGPEQDAARQATFGADPGGYMGRQIGNVGNVFGALNEAARPVTEAIRPAAEFAQEWGPSMALGGIAAPLVKPYVDRIPEGLEWSTENIARPLAEYEVGPVMRGEQDLRSPQGIAGNIAQIAAGPALTLAGRFGQEAIEKGPSEAWAAARERWRKSPEPIPGAKGVAEMVFDPVNALPLPGLEAVAKGVRAVDRALPRVGEGLGRLATEQSGVIPVSHALGIPMKTELPASAEFADAIKNTKGAELTPDGLKLSLVRHQQPSQGGEVSGRTGVFYLPAGDANVKYYRGGTNTYGGREKIEGETLFKRPLFVKGATGGRAPELAYDQINGKGAYEKMRREALDAMGQTWGRVDEDAQYARVLAFLERHGDPELTGDILSIKHKGNQLPYMLQEHAVAKAVRDAGYDSILGYSKRRDGNHFISEVFDVREADYPTSEGYYGVHPQFADDASRARWEREQAIKKGQQDMFGGEAAPETPLKPPATVEEEAQAVLDADAAIKRTNISFPIAEIGRDPVRFQYKIGSGPTGSTGSLSGVEEWDPMLAQGVMLWTDPATNKTWVVNGHNRLALADRLGVKSVDNPYFINAPTAEKARSKGALANIAEGHGTALDAAKFFKDSGYTEAEVLKKLPSKQKIVTDGLAISRLSDPMFQRIVRGELPEDWAAVIGARVSDPTLQNTVFEMASQAQKTRKVDARLVAELADGVVDAPISRGVQKTMFGDEELTVSHAIEKADISAYIKSQLGQDKRVFGSAASNAQNLERGGNVIQQEASRNIAQESAQNLTLFDTVKNHVGPVSAIIDDAARRIGAGENAVKVKAETYEQVRQALSETKSNGALQGAGRGETVPPAARETARPEPTSEPPGTPPAVARPEPPVENAAPTPPTIETPAPTPDAAQAVIDRRGEEARGVTFGKGAADQMRELLGNVFRPSLFKRGEAEGSRLPLNAPRPPQSRPMPPGGPGVQRTLPLNSGAELPKTLGKEQQAAVDKVLRYRGLKDEAKLPLLQSIGLTEEQARAALKMPKAGEKGSADVGTVLHAGAAAVGGASQYDPNASPEENAKNIAKGMVVGYGLGYAARKGVMGASVRSTGSPTRDAVLQMYDHGYQQPPTTVKHKLDAATAFLARIGTNQQVDLARYTARGEKAFGRPLAPAENLYYLKRQNVDAAAGQILDEQLAPALQRVGDDLPYLSEFVTYVHDLDIADAKGNPARLFSGGRTRAMTETALNDLQAQLGPARTAQIVQSAQDINDLTAYARQRLVDSGVWDTALVAEFERLYPNYVPTRILDYTLDPAHMTGGKGISMKDQGIRELTKEGTLREREDPINSVIHMIYATERRAKQNEAFNAFVKIRDADPELQATIIRSNTLTPTREQVAIEGFVNGKKDRLIAPRNLRLVTESESRWSVPILSGLMHLQRALFTAKNPAFVVANALVDAGTYAVRATMREAGARGSGSSLMAPVYLPKVVAELGRAYVDTFKGLKEGRFTGASTAEYLKGGGGMSGYFEGTLEQGRRTKEKLARPNVYTVNGAGDVLRIAKEIATLQPVTAVGERVELAPHVAQQNLALKRGANAQEAVMQGRDVTIDFAQGGEWAKNLNEILLFFNVGVQAMAQPVRAFREHPVAFASTLAGVLGGPLLASEAWNNSDEQRARDYADVPQNVKDRGIVFMLPGEAPLDKQGNRHPQMLLIPMRDWAPFVILGREAMRRAVGKEARDWKELAFEAGFSVSPIQGSGPADVLGGFMPSVIGTAAQLQQNKDWFRNRMIATDRGDEQASEISKGIAGATGARPSQVEFAARDIGGGLAGMALSAGDMLSGKGEKATGAQGIPVLGGLAGRFVKGNIGGQLDEAEQHLLQPWAENALAKDGVRLSIQPVGQTIDSVPLLIEEQTEYQLLVNQYVAEALANVMMISRWERSTPDQRREMAQSAIGTARKKAADRIYRQIGESERKRRMRERYGSTNPHQGTLTAGEKQRVLTP